MNSPVKNSNKGKVIQLVAGKNQELRLIANTAMDVDSIKKSLSIIIEISTALASLIKDFSIPAAAGLLFELAEFQTFVPVFKEALKEFKQGISPEESLEISNHIKGEFDIPNDQLEARIEKYITLIPVTYLFLKTTVISGTELYVEWRDAFKAWNNKQVA